ncbi:FGGY-family carbohydrate kinase [soil metagenome]
MAQYVIGIDCSTTATKAVVWDEEGNSVAEGRATFPLEAPRPGWYEQDAEEWWQSTKVALKEAAAKVDKGRIRALGITHQRESFVCTDEEGHPLRRAILWLDSRSYREVDQYGSDEFHEITGKPPSMTPALYKLFWMRNNEPEILDRTSMMLDVHAFLVHRLTGEWRTSWACADPLGLLDMRSFDWSDKILGEIGLERGQLAELSPPGSVVGELGEDVAKETGLPPGLPVVGGAGDGQAAGLGANVTEAGRAYLNLGTALVSGTYSDDYAWGREFRTLSGPIPKTYVPETLLRGGTYTIDWFVDNIGGIRADEMGLDLSAEQVLETAAGQVPPGAEGLLLLPYLNAASTPYWDSQARGVLFGLRGTHNKAHVYRAVLEGLAFEQRLETEAMEKGLGQPVEKYFAMGGGARSPLFCQMIADITGRPVTSCKEIETTCLGAAMMAAAATDDAGDLRDVAATMSGEGASYEPDEETSAFYDRVYTSVFKELYPRLSELFPALAEALESTGERSSRTT